MKRWIEHCTHEHSHCVEDLPQEMMPTRLIELDKNSTTHARLIDLNDKSRSCSTSLIRYAALSYCWSTTKQDGTTRSNLSSRLQQGLDILTLPKTLQDALLVTKALDLRYIWIDSLCIVQDDSDDWAKESTKMADIYKGAWVVVATASASDCALGFLQHREGTIVIEPHAEIVLRQVFVAQECMLQNLRRAKCLCSSERGLCKKGSWRGASSTFFPTKSFSDAASEVNANVATDLLAFSTSRTLQNCLRSV